MSPKAPMDDLLNGPRRDRRQSGSAWWGYPPGRPTYHSPYHLYLTMKGHAFTAYLRIYQPLAAFPPRERAEWAHTWRPARSCRRACWSAARSAAAGPRPRAHRRRRARARSGRAGGGRGLPLPPPTELRTLQSLVAFRSSVPDEVADARVRRRRGAGGADPGALGERAAGRAAIQQAAWHVPRPGSPCSRTASGGSGRRRRARWPGSPTGRPWPRPAAGSPGRSASSRS